MQGLNFTLPREGSKLLLAWVGPLNTLLHCWWVPSTVRAGVHESGSHHGEFQGWAAGLGGVWGCHRVTSGNSEGHAAMSLCACEMFVLEMVSHG